MIRSRANRSLILFIILFSVGFSANTSAGFFDDLKSKLDEEKAKLKEKVDKLSKNKSSDDKKDKKKKDKEKEQAKQDKPVPASAAQPQTDLQESARAKARLAAPAAAATGATATATTTTTTTTVQSVVSHEPTKTNNFSSVKSKYPWKGGLSAPIGDVYGWFSASSLYTVNLADTMLSGARSDLLYGTIVVFPYVFSLSGEKIVCAESYFGNLEHLEAGQSVKNIESKSILSEFEIHKSLVNKFVKFNDVQVINGYVTKDQVCTFSSITKADFPPKQNARFTLEKDASAVFLNPGVIATSSGRFFMPGGIAYHPADPGKKRLKFDSAQLLCTGGFSWSSSKSLNKLKDRFKNGEFNNINAAEIELVGVVMTESQLGLCEVDSIKVRKLK